VILGDTGPTKHQFDLRPGISRIDGDEIRETEWLRLISDINSITSGGLFSFPVLYGSKGGLEVMLPGCASEDKLANLCEITSSVCCISSSGTTVIRPEYSGTSAGRCWSWTWRRIVTILGGQDVA
jgi:hypothetical protein